MEKQIYHLILRSMNEELTFEEQAELEKAMASSPKIKEEFEKFQAQKELLAQQEFKLTPFLSTRVIAKLNKAYTKERTFLPGLSFAFNRIALPVLALLVVFVISTFITEQTISIDTLTGASELNVEELVSNVFVSL